MGRLADLDLLYPATGHEMGESAPHSAAQFSAYGALRAHFRGRVDCFVGQDFNLYYREGDGQTFVEPDLFVSFGVDRGAIEGAASYRLWESGAPVFVLEIASGRTHERDREEKPAIYLEIGAGEYWRFDPTGGRRHDPPLQGDRLVGGAWVPIEVTPDGDGGLRGASGGLGLDLRAEGSSLRFREPSTGLWLPDPDETSEELDAARARAADAEAARSAAEDESAAAEAARRGAEDRVAEAEDRAAAAEAEVAALRARLDDRNGETA